MSKKLVTMFLAALVLCLALAVPTMAATGINENEQKLLDKFEEKYTVEGKEYGLPTDYLNKAKAYLMQDGVDLTDAQVTEMVAKADEMKTLFVNNKITSLDALKNSSVKADALRIAQEGAAVVGCTVEFDAATNQIAVKNSDSQTIFESDATIKQTGMNLNATALIVVFVLAAFAGCAVVAKKKLFA